MTRQLPDIFPSEGWRTQVETLECGNQHMFEKQFPVEWKDEVGRKCLKESGGVLK